MSDAEIAFFIFYKEAYIGAIIKCDDCKKKVCLRTKIICEKMEKWLHKKVEKQFWHGIEGYMNRATKIRLVNIFYSIDIKEDREINCGEDGFFVHR